MAAPRQGLPVRLERAPHRGAAFALSNASKRARTRSIGSRSRGSLFIFRSSPAVAPNRREREGPGANRGLKESNIPCFLINERTSARNSISDDFAPRLRAELSGDRRCSAEGLTVNARAPFLAMARKLIAAGYDPHRGPPR